MWWAIIQNGTQLNEQQISLSDSKAFQIGWWLSKYLFLTLQSISSCRKLLTDDLLQLISTGIPTPTCSRSKWLLIESVFLRWVDWNCAFVAPRARLNKANSGPGGCYMWPFRLCNQASQTYFVVYFHMMYFSNKTSRQTWSRVLFSSRLLAAFSLLCFVFFGNKQAKSLQSESPTVNEKPSLQWDAAVAQGQCNIIQSAHVHFKDRTLFFFPRQTERLRAYETEQPAAFTLASHSTRVQLPSRWSLSNCFHLAAISSTGM